MQRWFRGIVLLALGIIGFLAVQLWQPEIVSTLNHPLLTPVWAQSTRTVDLVEYWSSNEEFPVVFCQVGGSPAEGSTINSTLNSNLDHLMQELKNQGAPGDNVFIVRGGMDEYFVYTYDDNFIYFLEDHVWGGMTCDTGEPAMYRVFDRSTGQWGVPYPRYVSNGQILTFQEDIRAYVKEDYKASFLAAMAGGSLSTPTECSNQHAAATDTQKEIEIIDDPASHPALNKCVEGPVVAFKATGGAGAGETMFLGKGLGMIGFTNEVDGSYQFHLMKAGPEASCDPELLCGQSGSLAGIPPLFVFPQTDDTGEWSKYLANTNVYCAPEQVNWPKLEGTDPTIEDCNEGSDESIDPLGAGNVDRNGACQYQEYPVVDYSEEYNISNATFPLWRSQNGGMSIEFDLSRVDPDDTFSEAAKTNSKPDYAPQFYLTTPQQQCNNAANYLDYVHSLCTLYGDPNACLAKKDILLPDGRNITWDAARTLVRPSDCLNYGQDLADQTDTAKIVQALAPSTPKIFKMGFLVQHNYMFSSKSPLFGAQYFVKKLAAWLRDEPIPPSTGETLTIVPVWYQAGLSTNEFTPQQTKPYTIDPTNPPSEPAVDATNFAGGWWRTYAAALPVNTQKEIMQTKTDLIVGTYGELNAYNQQLGSLANIDSIIPCEGKKCINNNVDYLENLRSSFPQTFEPSDGLLIGLQELVASRVNVGVQRTERYPLDEEGIQLGPLSVRSNLRCEIDQENYRYGEQERGDGISHTWLQVLREEGVVPAGEQITEVVTEFTGKILWDKGQNDAEQFHKSYSYLILPDEAIDIDIAQAYFAPMFLSPEMYKSIMSGENEIYPFVTDFWESPPNGVPEDYEHYLSAFLRGDGYDRQHRSDESGYVLMRMTQYRQVGNDCSGTVVRENDFWTLAPGEEQSPSPDNYCIGTSITGKSVVSVTGAKQGETPDSNIENPGNLATLHEFLRRMAFTPHYLIQEYEGLGNFYSGSSAYLQNLKKQMSDVVGTWLTDRQTSIPVGCVYQPREIDVKEEFGYDHDLRDYRTEPFRELLCDSVDDPEILGPFLRAALEVEGSPFLRAVRGAGGRFQTNPSEYSFVCQSNEAGAVGPFGLLVQECSQQGLTFTVAENSLRPDICTLEGAAPGAGDVVEMWYSLYKDDAPDIYGVYERMAQRFLGGEPGSSPNCGQMGDPNDGTKEAVAGSGEDYCAYVARRATQDWGGYCQF